MTTTERAPTADELTKLADERYTPGAMGSWMIQVRAALRAAAKALSVPLPEDVKGLDAAIRALCYRNSEYIWTTTAGHPGDDFEGWERPYQVYLSHCDPNLIAGLIRRIAELERGRDDVIEECAAVCDCVTTNNARVLPDVIRTRSACKDAIRALKGSK